MIALIDWYYEVLQPPWAKVRDHRPAYIVVCSKCKNWMAMSAYMARRIGKAEWDCWWYGQKVMELGWSGGRFEEFRHGMRETEDKPILCPKCSPRCAKVYPHFNVFKYHGIERPPLSPRERFMLYGARVAGCSWRLLSERYLITPSKCRRIFAAEQARARELRKRA